MARQEHPLKRPPREDVPAVYVHYGRRYTKLSGFAEQWFAVVPPAGLGRLGWPLRLPTAPRGNARDLDPGRRSFHARDVTGRGERNRRARARFRSGDDLALAGGLSE